MPDHFSIAIQPSRHRAVSATLLLCMYEGTMVSAVRAHGTWSHSLDTCSRLVSQSEHANEGHWIGNSDGLVMLLCKEKGPSCTKPQQRRRNSLGGEFQTAAFIAKRIRLDNTDRLTTVPKQPATQGPLAQGDILALLSIWQQLGSECMAFRVSMCFP